MNGYRFFLLIALSFASYGFGEVVTLPLSERKLDVTLVKKIAKMNYQDAVKLVKEQGIRVYEFDLCNIVSEIKSEKEEARLEAFLAEMVRQEADASGYFLPKDDVVTLPPQDTERYDTILLKQDIDDPNVVAHEFMHFLLSKEKRTYRQSELLPREPVASYLEQIRKWQFDNANDRFIFSKINEPDFYRNHETAVDFYLEDTSLLGHELIVAKMDEIDIHLFFYEHINPAAFEVWAAGGHLVILINESAKSRKQIIEIQEKAGKKASDRAKESFRLSESLLPIYSKIVHDFAVAYRKLTTAKVREEVEPRFEKMGLMEFIK